MYLERRHGLSGLSLPTHPLEDGSTSKFLDIHLVRPNLPSRGVRVPRVGLS